MRSRPGSERLRRRASRAHDPPLPPLLPERDGLAAVAAPRRDGRLRRAVHSHLDDAGAGPARAGLQPRRQVAERLLAAVHPGVVEAADADDQDRLVAQAEAGADAGDITGPR